MKDLVCNSCIHQGVCAKKNKVASLHRNLKGLGSMLVDNNRSIDFGDRSKALKPYGNSTVLQELRCSIDLTCGDYHEVTIRDI